MLVVYIGLQGSMNLPSLSRLPLTSKTVISIAIKKENLTHANLNDFSTRFMERVM